MVSRVISIICLVVIVCGCAASNAWSIQTIATGDKAFDFSRMRYASTQAHPPVLFEIIKMGDQIDSFISLNRFRFTSEDQIKILFTIGEESFEDSVTVHEGAMRVRLLPETTQRLIQALQDGHKVAILIDGFEETLEPKQFSSSFAQFAAEGNFFLNLFKGP